MSVTDSRQILQQCYDALQEIESLRQDGALDEALKLCQSLTARFPEYWGAQHTLGLIHADQKDHARALDALIRAQMLRPSSVSTLTALGGAYISLAAFEMAGETLRKAAALDPQNPEIHASLGELHRRAQDYESACASYEAALLADPTMVAARIGLGLCLVELGDLPRAAAQFESVARMGLKLIDPLYELSSLPPGLTKIDILSELAQVACESLRDQTDFEVSVLFTRGAALHAAGRHAEAWTCFTQANRKLFVPKRADYEQNTRLEAASLDALRTFAAPEPPQDDPHLPVSLFILGPSRSGKSTLEHLLARSPKVTRGFESTLTEACVERTLQDAGLPPAGFLEVLPRQLTELFRATYASEIETQARGRAVFTNTNPRLIHDAARILTSVPNARMILVKRDVNDNLFRIFTREYQSANAYAYDLRAARQHIVWYHAMTDLIAGMFPDRVRVISYDAIVESPASVVALASQLCGVDFGAVSGTRSGDDRGCALPYLAFMAAEAAQT